MKLIITGGHHTSALPVINTIQKDHPETAIHWIGHRHSLKGNKADTLEYKQITSLGIPFYELQAGKFYKTYDPIRLLKIPFGFFQAFYLLLKVRPDVILSFGGYLAVPVVLAAWVLRIPSITHEQTVVIGHANKLISKFAKKLLISWKASAKFFPPKKTVFTGLPLRENIFMSQSNTFNIANDLPTVYITTGKSGSKIINNVVKETLRELLQFCNIIHQCGEHSLYNYFQELGAEYERIKNDSKGQCFLKTYVLENEIGEVLTKADLIVSRAGAHTISEILALEKPSVLIPIPWVSHNEQYKNAKLIESKGLGKIINEKELSKESLLTTIKESLENLPANASSKTTTLIVRDAAQKIVNEVFKLEKKQ